MRFRGLTLIGFLLLAPPAVAQTQPATGVLQAPTKPQAPAAPQVTPATNPPAPAPRAGVQQVAPLASPSLLGKSDPGKPPPVVQPPANTHAQKPPPPKPVPPKPGAAPAKAAPPPPSTAPSTATPAATGVVAGVAAGAVAGGVAPSKPIEPSIGSVTKAPLPRFASLRSDEVNLRTGPGTRYPIEWQYHRRDLPVEIEREFETWRLIVDQDGVKGWVHSATLVSRRGFVVRGKERVLRKSAADDAAAVAILKPGVVGRIRSCEAAKPWCDLQVGEHRGWLKREDIWGVYPTEAVN
ncbi:MAG: SH3 domain-containing protein [Alphaproteobacteria bacterium]|nr:SH3 domain-containing protein [Alphaproteobacteria bacterium]